MANRWFKTMSYLLLWIYLYTVIHLIKLYESFQYVHADRVPLYYVHCDLYEANLNRYKVYGAGN